MTTAMTIAKRREFWKFTLVWWWWWQNHDDNGDDNYNACQLLPKGENPKNLFWWQQSKCIQLSALRQKEMNFVKQSFSRVFQIQHFKMLPKKGLRQQISKWMAKQEGSQGLVWESSKYKNPKTMREKNPARYWMWCYTCFWSKVYYLINTGLWRGQDRPSRIP